MKQDISLMDLDLTHLQVHVLAAGLSRIIPVHASHHMLLYSSSGFGSTDHSGKDQILFVPAGQDAEFGSRSGQNAAPTYWVHFDACLGNTSIFDVFPVPRLISLQDPKLVRSCFERLLEGEENKTRFASVLRQQAAILELIALMIDHVPDPLRMTHQLWIDQAKELLRKGDMSIGMIALQLGFCDHSYFSKVFRKNVGKTPIEYRREALSTHRISP